MKTIQIIAISFLLLSCENHLLKLDKEHDPVMYANTERGTMSKETETAEAVTELNRIMREIHIRLDAGESEEIKGFRALAHEIIMNHDISYTDIYKVMRTNTINQGEFNLVMGRIRKTMLRKGIV